MGEVFYGNIGSADRLDVTVVGPAVNEASRIATMCRSFDRVILSSEFAAALEARFCGPLRLARHGPRLGVVRARFWIRRLRQLCVNGPFRAC